MCTGILIVQMIFEQSHFPCNASNKNAKFTVWSLHKTTWSYLIWLVFLSLRKWYIDTQMKKNNKMNFKKFHDMCSYCGLGNLIVWYICRCICPREYTGRHCEELYVPCQPSPCRNGGTCIPSGGLSYQCICQSGRFSTRKEQSSTASTPLYIASTPLNIAVCYLGYMGTLK